MWLNLMKRLSLIDALEQTCVSVGVVKLSARILPLGSFRLKKLDGEVVSIKWKRSGASQKQYDDQFEILVDSEEEWTAYVELKTPLVKQSFQSEKTVRIKECS